MYDKLTLSTLSSPFITRFSTPKGIELQYFNAITKHSPLSHIDIDSNFLYLKGNIIFNASISNENLLLSKINGEIISIPFINNQSLLNENVDMFSPSSGQIYFTLSHLPLLNTVVQFFVNGIEINSFIVDGLNITYTGLEYDFTPTDIVKFLYYS